jgi:hypothetical protein
MHVLLCLRRYLHFGDRCPHLVSRSPSFAVGRVADSSPVNSETGLFLTAAGACVSSANCPVSTYPKSAALQKKAVSSAVSTCAPCEDGATKCTATCSTAW